jgi:methanogenic corrinoid protein MtbC1
VEKEIIRLAKAILNMNPAEAEVAAKDCVAKGINMAEVIRKGIAEPFRVLGEKFKRMEIFLPELMAASEAFYQAFDVIRAEFEKGMLEKQFWATMVIGTIFGDIHTVGKDIFIPIAMAEGIKVIDLGIDVPPEKFVEAIKKYNPDIIGFGTYMAETLYNSKVVLKAIEDAGLRENRIVAAGGPAVAALEVDSEKCREFGLDVAATDAFRGIQRIKEEFKRRKGGKSEYYDL